MKTAQPISKYIAFYLIWLVTFASVLWYSPKPWNFVWGNLFVVALFALPDVTKGIYTPEFLKNDSRRFEWSRIEFVAWCSVILSGLLAIGAIRLKSGLLSPLNVAVDGTVALILGTSAVVNIARGWNGQVSDRMRKRAKKDAVLPATGLIQTVFVFLSFVFVLNQIYLIWTTLKATTPVLLTNYPTISWGYALIYLAFGVATSIIELMNGWLVESIKTE